MAISYTVQHTDTSKTPISVNDQTINTETSMTLIGNDYFNYGPPLATNFIHLLENFANITAPTKPVQGQLWFDTASKQLMVNTDGVHWSTTGSVKKSIAKPTGAIVGDIWVDTLNQQLYIYKGVGNEGDIWTLVGPEYSQNTITGQKIQTIIDSSSIEHDIISLYADNVLIAIVSNNTFTPRKTIQGFVSIKAGITLNSNYKLNGTTTNAETLGGNSASSFLSISANNTIAAGKYLAVDSINLGTDRNLNIFSEAVGVSGRQYVVETTERDLEIRTTLATPATPVAFFGNDQKVGINTRSPAETLDVSGNIKSKKLVITDVTDTSISTLGGLSVTANTTLKKNLTITNGVLTIGNVVNTVAQAGSVILPDTTETYDIGSYSKSFRNVYSQTFNGNVLGNVVGNVDGNITGVSSYATRLQYPTNFSLSGDITSAVKQFTGSASANSTVGTFVIDTTLSNDAVSSREELVDSQKTDSFLVHREFPATVIGYISGTTLHVTNHVYGTISKGMSVISNGDEISGTIVSDANDSITITISKSQTLGTITSPVSIQFGSASLYKMSRRTLFSSVKVVGSVILYAGTGLPNGYVLCNGASYQRSIYSDLYDVIGITYGVGSGNQTFGVPNLTAPAANLKYVIFTGLYN